jgi:hypothetical protein
MFTIEYVKNLKWANAEHTAFDCVVKYAEFEFEFETTINTSESYPHVQEIWTKANEGQYGQFEEYVEPPQFLGEIEVVDVTPIDLA